MVSEIQYQKHKGLKNKPKKDIVKLDFPKISKMCWK